MPLDDIEEKSQCSSVPHIRAICRMCGEEITSFTLRHDIHKVDDAHSSASTEEVAGGTIETLNPLSDNNALVHKADITDHAMRTSPVDTPLNPEGTELPSIHSTAELEKDATASPVHQNHIEGNEELAEELSSHSDTETKLPPTSRDKKRNLRFSLATDIKASTSMKEHLHKKNAPPEKPPDFMDYRTSPPKVKKLYWSARRWSEYANADIEAKELKRLSERDDIVHRQIMRTDVNDSGQLWETFSVVVRGRLKRMLQERVFKDHPGIGNPNADELVLERPFTPVVHRWKMMEDLLKEPTRPFGVETLSDILLPCVEKQLSVIEQIRSSGLCSWVDLNLILCPGEVVLSHRYGIQAAFKVQHVHQMNPRFDQPYQQVSLQYVDWNGQYCGHATTIVKIEEFSGTRDISSLEVVALASLDQQYQVDIRAKLQSRGRKFEQLRGYHFKTSNGTRVVLEMNKVTGDIEPIDKSVCVFIFLTERSFVID